MGTFLKKNFINSFEEQLLSISIGILNAVEYFVHKQPIGITAKTLTTLYLHSHSMPIPGYTLSADLCTEMLRQLEEDQSTQREDPTQTGGAVSCNTIKFMENIAAQTFYGYKNRTVLCP
jgi:hypothetical protein